MFVEQLAGTATGAWTERLKRRDFLFTEQRRRPTTQLFVKQCGSDSLYPGVLVLEKAHLCGIAVVS